METLVWSAVLNKSLITGLSPRGFLARTFTSGIILVSSVFCSSDLAGSELILNVVTIDTEADLA